MYRSYDNDSESHILSFNAFFLKPHNEIHPLCCTNCFSGEAFAASGTKRSLCTTQLLLTGLWSHNEQIWEKGHRLDNIQFFRGDIKIPHSRMIKTCWETLVTCL